MEPLGFYTHTIYPHTSFISPPQSSASAAEPLHVPYLAGLTSLPLLCYPEGWQFLAPAVPLSMHLPGWHHQYRAGNPWPLCALTLSRTCLSNCSVHTELPAPKVFLNNLLIKPFFIMPLKSHLLERNRLPSNFQHSGKQEGSPITTKI